MFIQRSKDIEILTIVQSFKGEGSQNITYKERERRSENLVKKISSYTLFHIRIYFIRISRLKFAKF